MKNKTIEIPLIHEASSEFENIIVDKKTETAWYEARDKQARMFLQAFADYTQPNGNPAEALADFIDATMHVWNKEIERKFELAILGNEHWDCNYEYGGIDLGKYTKRAKEFQKEARALLKKYSTEPAVKKYTLPKLKIVGEPLSEILGEDE